MTIPADSTDIDHPIDSTNNNDDTPVDFTNNDDSVTYDKINCHFSRLCCLHCLPAVNLLIRLTQNNLRGLRSYRPHNTSIEIVKHDFAPASPVRGRNYSTSRDVGRYFVPRDWGCRNSLSDTKNKKEHSICHIHKKDSVIEPRFVAHSAILQIREIAKPATFWGDYICRLGNRKSPFVYSWLLYRP